MKQNRKYNLQEVLPNMNFAICFIEGTTPTSLLLLLSELLDVSDDMEYKYAIHDRMEEVISLPVGGRLKMWFNRDNANDSTGFIKRIK